MGEEIKNPEQILNEAKAQASAITKKAQDDAKKIQDQMSVTFEDLKKKAIAEASAEIAAMKRLPDEIESGKEDPTKDVFTRGKWFKIPVLPVNFKGHGGGV